MRLSCSVSVLKPHYLKELTTAQKVTNMLIYEQLSEDWEWRQHTHHLTEFLSLNNEYFQNATGALLLILLITTHLIKAGSFLEQLVISGGLFSIEKIYKSVIAFLSFFLLMLCFETKG